MKNSVPEPRQTSTETFVEGWKEIVEVVQRLTRKRNLSRRTVERMLSNAGIQVERLSAGLGGTQRIRVALTALEQLQR